jgi:hypothetical protein
MLELGPSEQGIAKQAVRSGQPVPERIANAPQLRFGLQFYLQAFFDLDSDRQVGMSLGRIPWSVVTKYAEVYRLTEEDTERLHYFIRAMDIAYLKWQQEKDK